MVTENDASPDVAEEIPSGTEPSADGASGEGAAGESEGGEQRSTDWEKRYKDTERAYHDAQRRAKELEEQNNLFREHYTRAEQSQRSAADPYALVEAELADATTSFDKDAIMVANRKLRELLVADARRAASETALQSMKAQQGLERAKAYGVSDPNVLADVYRTVTPDELAAVKALRDGRLGEIVSAEQRERQRKATEAQQLQSILSAGFGGGRMPPGTLDAANTGPAEVPQSEYFAVSEAARKRRWPNGVKLV